METIVANTKTENTQSSIHGTHWGLFSVEKLETIINHKILKLKLINVGFYSTS